MKAVAGAVLGLLLVATSLPLSASSTGLAAQRTQFVTAERAIRERRDDAAAPLLKALRDYPLYPYLRYQQLSRDLRRVQADAIDGFLATYADVPVSRRLQRRWQYELLRREQWRAFADSYQPGGNERLDCHYANALSKLNETSALAALRNRLWQSGKSRPKACDAIFRAGLKSGDIGQDAIYARYKLALQHGANSSLARYLSRKLTGSYRDAAQRWALASNAPLKFIESFRTSADDEATARLQLAYQKLARQSADLAADTWLRRGNTGLPAATINAIRRNIGRQLLGDFSPRGLAWLHGQPDSDLDTETLRRAAFNELLQDDKKAATASFTKLALQQPDKDEWRYWLARTSNNPQDLAELAQQRSYYGFLAADALKQSYQMNDRPLRTDPHAVARLADEPAAQRAHEFLLLGRRQDARREWQQLIRNRSREALTAAAQLADSWGWHSRAILTIAKTRQFDDLELRFPLAHLDAVRLQSENTGIDPTWALAVIRQESAFSTDIRSPSGALGLMQLMPRTAQHVADGNKLAYRGRQQLKQPRKNVQLGVHYLAEMLHEFDGHLVLATAAYNAGPNRVKRWLKQMPVMDTTLWIEHIPFRETRDYVKRVLAYKIIYADRLNVSTARLSDKLLPIPAGLDTYSGLNKKPADHS